MGWVCWGWIRIRVVRSTADDQRLSGKKETRPWREEKLLRERGEKKVTHHLLASAFTPKQFWFLFRLILHLWLTWTNKDAYMSLHYIGIDAITYYYNKQWRCHMKPCSFVYLIKNLPIAAIVCVHALYSHHSRQKNKAIWKIYEGWIIESFIVEAEEFMIRIISICPKES